MSDVFFFIFLWAMPGVVGGSWLMYLLRRNLEKDFNKTILIDEIHVGAILFLSFFGIVSLMAAMTFAFFIWIVGDD